MPERPNILLLVVDCLRADRLLGPQKTARTPNLDRLRSAGCTWDTLIVETPSTTPCFASMLTGCYSFRHGVVGVGGYRLAPELPTLAERLRHMGYATFAEVTGPLVPAAGLMRGFDGYSYRVALDDLRGRWGVELIERLRRGLAPAPWFLLLHLWELHVVRCVPRAFDRAEFGADTYDRALSALDDALGPLLAALPQDTVVLLTGDHGEKTQREQYRAGSAVDDIRRRYSIDRAGRLGVRALALALGPVAMHQLRARFQPRLEAFSLRESPCQLRDASRAALRDLVAVARVSPWCGPRGWALLARGRGAISAALADGGWLDAAHSAARIDRLVRLLGEERLFSLYLRMWRAQVRKQLDEGHVLHLYDWLVRVPLIVRASARVAPGTCVKTMARQVDLAPTILQLAGVDAPNPCAAAHADAADGRSLLPAAVAGEAPCTGACDIADAPPALLSVRGQPRDACLRGLRTQRFKLTYGPDDPQLPTEFYDLRDDPDEMRNLAAELPDEVSRLRRLTESLIPVGAARVERLDPLPSNEQALIEERLRALGYVE